MDKYQEQELYKVVGSRIKDFRKSAEGGSVSQEQLANAIGLSRTSVVNIESGRQRIQLHILYDITNVLKCRTGDLLPETSVQEEIPTSKTIRKLVRDLKTEEEKESVKRLIQRAVRR